MEKKISALSLLASLLAIGITVYSHLSARSELKTVQDATYQKILRECYEELEPAYKEWGLKYEEPKSFSTLLRPLAKLFTARPIDPEGKARPLENQRDRE